MKNIKISFFVFLLFLFSAASYAQEAEITFDYSQEKGKFSRYLFGAFDAPYYDEKGFQLIKNANFKIVCMMDRDLDQERARALAEGHLAGAIFYTHNRYLEKQALEKNIQSLLNKIDSLKKRYPDLELKTFLFANEPDLPKDFLPNPFWSQSDEELFKNYAVFARYLKRKNPEYIVGGLGFAGASTPSGKEWIKNFVEYADKNNVPLDFIAYHAYSYEINDAFTNGFKYIEETLAAHPGLSPVFGTPKIALTEMDIQALPIPGERQYPQMHTDWRAAHNILALSALAEKGLWMSAETGGPFPDYNDDANFLWVKQDGALKPIYYAHKAFNELADTTQIAQEGSNFETFGAVAGKSGNNDSLVIVISNYDENAFLSDFSEQILPPVHPPLQNKDLKTYKSYNITVKNLPWKMNDTFLMEVYAVDRKHNLELTSLQEVIGQDKITITRDIGLPQVQLIKIRKK